MKFFYSCCFVLSAVVSCSAIVCNFTYTDDMKNYPEKLINSILTSEKRTSFKSKASFNSSEFYCDDDTDDSYEVGTFRGPVIKTHNTKFNLDSRFGNTASKEAPVASSPTLDDDSFESESLCDVIIQKIYPKTLPNILNKLVVVVNHGKFKQEVTIEKCSGDANQACKFSSNFPLGYVTKCKQKYQTHTIKVVSEHDQDIVDETVYLPSGCDCQFKYKGRN